MLSTTEAEYIAAVEAGKEIIWMCQLLSEFGYNLQLPSKLLVDNQSAIAVSRNPEHRGRMKHLDLRFFCLGDTADSGLIVPSFIPTVEQAADIFTKVLPRDTIARCRDLLGLVL